MGELKQFMLPDVGEGLTEADIVKWHVRPGDTVEINQTIVEIETAKAMVELPCPFEGTVTELLVEEGTTVDVGVPIITVDVGGDALSGESGAPVRDAGVAAPPAEAAREPGLEGSPAPMADPSAPEQKRVPVLVGYGVKPGATKRRARRPGTGPASGAAVAPAGSAAIGAGAPADAGRSAGAAATSGASAGAAATAAAPVASARTEPAAPVTPGSAPVGTAAGATARVAVLAKPPVRKMAKDLGVDLTTIIGTGPQGSITRDDVQQAAAPATQPAPSPVQAQGVPEERIPIKGVRKHMAAAMVQSAFTAPHVTEWLQVDVTETTNAVRRLREMPDFDGVKVSPLLLVARALLLAVRRHPLVNSSWDEQAQEIVIKHYVNLGIAAATERGLIVPNVKDAQDLPLPDLARALADLATTARAGRTPPQDMAGGTITITNIGVFGVDAGTPILTPGESAILAFGQIRDMPWVHEGEITVRKVTTLALSFDHRIVDGELGSNVLREVGAMLEDPIRMLAWS